MVLAKIGKDPLMKFTEIMKLWRVSEDWPCNKLSLSKVDSKIFAKSFNIPVPELYWVGSSQNLPLWRPNKYVIKPNCGSGSRNVFFVFPPFRNDNIHFAKHETVIMEELILTDGFDYKFWMIQDTVVTIQVIDQHTKKMQFYSPTWGEGLVTRSNINFDARRPKPFCLDDMIDIAKTLGKAAEVFLRIDLFAWPGPCFNEVTHNPNALTHIDPAADVIMGDILCDKGLVP